MSEGTGNAIGVRIRVLSDLHLEFADFRPPPAPADVVVLAGDVHVGTKGIRWAREAFPDLPVLYVPGNHEHYRGAIPRVVEKLRHAAEGTNVHVLDEDVVEIAGLRFAGCTLWTDLALVDGNPFIGGAAAVASMSDYRLIRVAPQYRRLRPEDTIRLHASAIRWLRRELCAARPPDVVISHHAPLPQSLDPRFAGSRTNAAYASDLSGLVAEGAPRLWVHGHVHHAAEYVSGGTRVVCNPRGYPGEPGAGFRPDLVVSVARARG